MNAEIKRLSANREMELALTDAAERGLWSGSDPDPETLRWWRDSDGRLFASERTAVIPGARRVEVEYERGAGYRAAD